MFVAMIILGILTVLAACGVIAAQKPINSALWLVVTLFLVAGHFALMGAHFVAAIQILVYAGAIMVLVVFVIMLLGTEGQADSGRFTGPMQVFLAVLAGAFVAVLTSGTPITRSTGHGIVPGLSDAAKQLPVDFGTVEAVGRDLFTRYWYPFQLTGVLLLSALIGAVVLAAEARRPLAKGRGLKAMQQRHDQERERLVANMD